MKNKFQKLLSICTVLMFVFSLLPAFATASTLAVSSYWMESGSKNLVVEQGKNAEFAFVIISTKKFDYQANLLGSDGKAIETLASGEKMNANIDGFFNKLSVDTSELKAGEYTIMISAQAIDGSDASVLYLTVKGKAALPQCNDGKDNDGDGKVDLQDIGCNNTQDDNEADHPTPQSNNKAPVLSPVNDMTFVEGESLTFQLKATDENNDKILYSYFISTPGYQTIDKPGLSGASFNKETGVFTWNPGYDLVKHPSKEAVIDLIFFASDGLLKDQDEVKFTVKDTNQNPSVSLVEMTPGKTLTEEEKLKVVISAKDADGDKLTAKGKIAASTSGFWNYLSWYIFGEKIIAEKDMTVMADGQAVFTWTPTKKQAGEYKLIFTAEDSFDGSNTQTVDLTVLDKEEPQVNHAPELENIPDQTVEAGKAFSYQVKAADEDGEKLDYSLIPGTTWLQIDASTGLLKGTANKEGAYEYNAYVSDGKAGDSDKFTIIVTSQPAQENHKPVITSKPVSEGYVNTKYVYDVRALDVDKNKLTYSLTVAPAGMGINSETGLISWTPVKEGKYHVTVKASDGKDSAVQSYTLIIKKKYVQPENNAPVLNELGTVSIKLGETVSKLVTGYDQDKELLVLKILNMNVKGMTLTTAGKNMWLFNWKPSAVGTFPVIFQLSDGKGGVQGTLDVEVTEETPLPENHAPMITSNPITEATVGEIYTYQLTAVDEDKDLITFMAKTSLPEGMSLNGATGEITWTPKEAGEVVVNFAAFDGKEESAPQEFTIIISAGGVIPSENNAPVLKEVTGLPDFYYEGDLVSFYLEAEDIDLDELTLTTDSSLGSVEKVGDHTWAFSWQTAKGDAGEYELSFTVSDGQESDSQTVSLKVAAKEEPKPTINKKPYFITVAPTEATLGKTYQYTVKAKDPEGQPVALTLKTGPEGMEIDTNNLITWKVEKNGQFKVVIEADDGEMLEQQVYYITVSGQNNKLGFDDIQFEEDEVSAGDSLIAKVDIVNSGYQKMEDVTITISIPELGIKKTSGLFDIKKNKQISKQISLELPEEIDAGEYDVKITVSNDVIYNVAYRTVEVK